MQVHVKRMGLSSFAMYESGALCAAGSAECDDSGTPFALRRSLFYRKAGRRSSDVSLRSREILLRFEQSLAALFKRETLREKNLDKANRVMKIRARKEAKKKDESTEAVDPTELERLEEQF